MSKIYKGQTVKLIDDPEGEFYYVDTFTDRDGSQLMVLAGLAGEDFLYVPVENVRVFHTDKEQQVLDVMVDISSLLRTLIRESGLYDRQNAQAAQIKDCDGECEGCGCDLDDEDEEKSNNEEDDKLN